MQGSTPLQYRLRFWGLSAFVGDDVLFDTFSSYWPLAFGLWRAGKKLKDIRTIVISHDHWDHTGGLEGALRRHSDVDLYVPPDMKPSRIETYKALGARVHSGSFTQLAEGLWLLPAIEGTFARGKVMEQALAIQSEGGLTLLTGCSHPGALPMLRLAKEKLGQNIVRLIGGLHLMNADEATITQTAQALAAEGIRDIQACHCTGAKACKILGAATGKK